MMGQGPTIVIVPDGGNDCGPYEKMMDYLSDEFTVLTFDPRGGSRSPDPHPRPVTPEFFSDDIAALVQEVEVETPISAFGVSSGGQAVLALAKFHTAIMRNGVVHEAALQADTPLRNAGFEYFQTIATLSPKIADPATISAITLVGTVEGIEAIDAAQRARMAKNRAYWAQYYLGTVDMGQYFEEDFAHMAPVDYCLWHHPGNAAWARTDPACPPATLEREIGTCRGREAFDYRGLTNRLGKICLYMDSDVRL